MICHDTQPNQITYNYVYLEFRKSPSHTMTGKSIDEKWKSEELITTFNLVELSVNSPEVILHHHKLVQYSVKRSPSAIPIPTHFKTDSDTIDTFDNFNHEEPTLYVMSNSLGTCKYSLPKIPPRPDKLKACLSQTDVIQGMKVIQ